MSDQLIKRILTSTILVIIFFISFFYSKYSWLVLISVISLLGFYELINILRKVMYNNSFLKILFTLLILIYFVLLLYSSYTFYHISKIYLLYVISICVFSDVGGYLVGKSLGGKKLTKISPNKTISGSIGSFVFSLVPTFIILKLFENTSNEVLLHESVYKQLIFCLILSLICQIGDIFISYIKRLAKLKDTGKILPGHGGILDRIDGMMFVLPISFIYFNFYF